MCANTLSTNQSTTLISPSITLASNLLSPLHRRRQQQQTPTKCRQKKKRKECSPIGSQLPPELLSRIAGTLDDAADRVRFVAVCRPWGSAASESTAAGLLPQIRSPWLLLPPNSADDLGAHHKTFFNISTNKFYSFDFPADARDKSLTCFSSGWIFAVDSFPGRRHPIVPLLLNPVTGAQIWLPPLPPLPPEKIRMVRRCELTVVGGPQALIVVMLALRDGPILCCRQQLINGGGENNPAEWMGICDGDGVLDDGGRDFTYNARVFTYFQGRYFVFGTKESVTSVIDPHTKQVVQLIPQLPGTELYFRNRNRQTLRRRYLVRSSSGEELFLVIAPSRTLKERFEVFGLDKTEQQTKWSKVRSIGGDVLFVDNDRAMALPASDSSTCRRNCIVFLNSSVAYGAEDVPLHGCWDKDVTRFGLFDFGNDRVEQLPCMNRKDRGHQMWFVPSLS